MGKTPEANDMNKKYSEYEILLDLIIELKFQNTALLKEIAELKGLNKQLNLEYSQMATDWQTATKLNTELLAKHQKQKTDIKQLQAAFDDRVRVIELQLEDKSRLAEALYAASKQSVLCEETRDEYHKLAKEFK